VTELTGTAEEMKEMKPQGADAEARAPASVAPKSKRVKEKAVAIRGLTKRFGQKVAVDNVSFEIEAGSVYGLIGPNGAGKTTTFSMMAGFLEPTEGGLEVLGYSPRDVASLKSRLGVLPQDAVLPRDERTGEFLTYLARLQGDDRVEAERAARAVLEEVEGKDWWALKHGQLSHGMAKRVQLAQALLGDPEVVLLDEPTAGLDPRHAYEVRQLIKARRGRCTMIVSSHNLHELEEICDAACILDRGRVVASGSISELTASSEEIHILLTPTPKTAPNYRGPLGSTVPLADLRGIPHVSRVEFHDEERDLVLYLARGDADPETVIGQALWVLLNQHILIRGVTLGRGLERRVMDLT
jgi:ABC-type multidrug transport system ATPase subunit